MRNILRCSLALRLGMATLAVAVLCVPSYAQSVGGSITGLVKDESGAAVPGASISAMNFARNVTYTATSNGVGNYTITNVTVGSYVVKAELKGFKTSATKALDIEAQQTARIDFKMSVGALEDTIEVTAVTAVLQTESATVGEVISGNTVQSLPLNGRNTGQLALLLPGVLTPSPRGFNNIGSVNMNRPFVNGNREQTNNFTVDGLDANETIDNRVSYQPSPDAIAQISVETNNYSADVGNVGGAIVSSIIKSGSNALSGSAFEFYRNSSLDANTWENNRSAAPKQERKQHIYGATLGGPIRKNKLFFFADYQGSRQDAPGFTTASVAPAAWRAGDLSSVTAAIIDPLTGVRFPNNQIPLSRISASARAILNDLAKYPLPNRTVAGGVTGNFVGETLLGIRAHQGDLRLDWNASGKDKVWMRYSFATYVDEREKQPFALFMGSRNDQPFYNVGANWTRVLGSSTINELQVGYSNTKVVAQTLDWAGIGNGNAAYSITGGQPIAGLSSIGWGSGLTAPGAVAADSDTLAKTYQLNEKFTWLRGRHALKFGGQFLHYDQQRFYAGNNGLLGFLNFNGAFTGFAFSDFLLDLVSSKGRGGGDPAKPWTHLQNRIGLFVQDDFKVKPNLTVNLGLRWAYTSPLVEKNNLQTNFDLKTGKQIFASDADRALYKAYYGGFEPRLGVAWTMNERTVFRAGYGISQFMEGTGANLRLPMNPPFFFESAVTYDRTTGAGSLGQGFAGLVPGTTPSGNVRAFDPNLRPQFSQQWNAFIERRLTAGMSAQIGYVGNRASNLVTPVEGNQALPGTGDPATWAPKNTRRPLFGPLPLVTTIATTASRGRSEYNALQASVRQRFEKGLEFMASYTWSKGMSNNRGFYGQFGGPSSGGSLATEGAYWQNTYDPNADWGPMFYDLRHNFVLSGSYELPFGKGRKWGANWSGVANGVLGGWKVAGIYQARTGFPITVIDTRARSLQGERGSERPNCVGNPVPSDQSITKWLDINAFSAAALGTFGNCPVGVARMPGYQNVDLTLSKRFDLGARRGFEVRVEAFNAFNHPSFGPPARDLSVPNTFGQITSTVSSPRVVELVAKFTF